jgi:hypothetical protein
VAVRNYDIVYIKRGIQSAPRIVGVLCGVWSKYKYKGMHKWRVEVIDRVYVYGYVSFGLVTLFIIGLVMFS